MAIHHWKRTGLSSITFCFVGSEKGVEPKNILKNERLNQALAASPMSKAFCLSKVLTVRLFHSEQFARLTL